MAAFGVGQFFVIIAILHSAGGIARRPAVDKILSDQRLRIIKGESIKVKMNPVERDLLNNAFVGKHGGPVTVREIPKDRKEYRCLSTSERQNLHAALKTLKTTKAPGATLTFYDSFIAQHDRESAPGAHFGPAFGPWHRHFLYSFELILQKFCPTCTWPFWDNRMEFRLGGNPQHSVLFSPVLLGNAVGPVVNGFAANWTSPGRFCSAINPTLRRNLVTDVLSFFTDADVEFCEDILDHKAFSYPWDDRFEMQHGYVHTAFGSGSHMASILCSPCDPVFILHHSFMDNLFERSRTNMKLNDGLVYVDVNDLPQGFVDIGNIVRVHSAPNASMLPFKRTINSYGLLSDDYTYSGYRYERSPGDIDCVRDSDCCANGNQEFIWCDANTRKCVSKVKEGGSVKSTFPVRACYCPPGKKPAVKLSKCSCT